MPNKAHPTRKRKYINWQQYAKKHILAIREKAAARARTESDSTGRKIIYNETSQKVHKMILSTAIRNANLAHFVPNKNERTEIYRQLSQWFAAERNLVFMSMEFKQMGFTPETYARLPLNNLVQWNREIQKEAHLGKMLSKKLNNYKKGLFGEIEKELEQLLNHLKK